MGSAIANEPPEGMLPWRHMLEISYGMLGLNPDDFWKMTPAEWLAAVNGWKISRGIATSYGRESMSRAALDRMMRRFPDSAIAPGNYPSAP